MGPGPRRRVLASRLILGLALAYARLALGSSFKLLRCHPATLKLVTRLWLRARAARCLMRLLSRALPKDNRQRQTAVFLIRAYTTNTHEVE